jgi:hypothetical protein
MADSVFRLDGDGDVGAEQLEELKRRCVRWNQRAAGFFQSRYEAEKARRCEWSGQSADGRVWDDLNTGETRGLFNGASDLRMRWGDRITLDKQALLIGALGIANISISGTGAAAQRLAGNMLTLLGWLRRSLGANWMRAWMELTNWYVGDSPAVALMAVRWRKERLLVSKSMTLDELRGLWLARETARTEGDEYAVAAAAERVEALLGEIRGSGLGIRDSGSGIGDSGFGIREKEEGGGALAQAAALVAEQTGAENAEALRAVREMAATGRAEFAAEAGGEEGVELLAKRFGEDFVLADNCRRFEAEGLWFMPEWVGLEELQTRGWDKDFVEEVAAQGETPVLTNGPYQDTTPAGESGTSAREGRRQVVWAYVTGVDAKGRKGKYVCVFGAGERTAFGWMLLRGWKGRWPAALFQRETLSGYALDSRGVSELAAPAQGMAKALWDGSANNAMLAQTPPILAKGHSVRNQFVSPLKVIGMSVNEEFGYMRAPEFPATSMRVADEIERQEKDYFGQPHEKSDGVTVATRQRAEVAWFLAQAGDVLRMMLELAQANASDELLAQVTDDSGAAANLRREDIAGTFGLTLEFNADDLDTDKVIAKAKAMGQIILAMDRNQVVDTTPLVSSMTVKMFPDVGPRALRSAEAGAENERQDEARNLALIRSGVMPKMNTEGLWNYAARLQFYVELQQQNPACFDDMAPDKRDMLARWTAALAQQETQYGRNRSIGRTGVEGVGE